MQHRFYSNIIINFADWCHSYIPTAEHLCYNAVAQQNHIKIWILYTSVLPRTSRTIKPVPNPSPWNCTRSPKMLHYGTKYQLYDTGCTSCKIRNKYHLRVPEVNASIAGYLANRKRPRNQDTTVPPIPLLQRVHLLRSFSTASCENYCLELTSWLSFFWLQCQRENLVLTWMT